MITKRTPRGYNILDYLIQDVYEQSIERFKHKNHSELYKTRKIK